MHAVNERLTLVALAATDVEFAVLAHLLCAGQRLQGCHDVAARVARHHNVQGVHRLEVVALAEVVAAGGDHHFIDGGCAFAHLQL